MNKKNTTKKSIKFKPAYTVNIANCEDATEVALEFALAKQNAGLHLTNENLEAIVNRAIDVALESEPTVIFVNECECNCSKKKPWYKRFWNWLLGRK